MINKSYNFGDILLAEVQYTDTFEIKTRPVLVLFEDFGNVVVAGITSNPKMKGILLSKKDGAVRDSVIKLNYIFTISEQMIKKYIFKVSEEKKRIVKDEIIERLN
ncbi:type II toxin-antitoxin system PemK/MazF family toxin [Candidatus Pacearchaeota archaeon]|nr:type II toxin-antitoxin system PemK/MazF family toxin [Candidatus Pacearchaeota archaeon]